VFGSTASFTIVNTPDTGWIPFTPNIHTVALGGQNDALVVASAASSSAREVVSFDLAARQVRWRAVVPASGNMAVAGNRVYVPAEGRLVVLNQTTGQPAWSWDAPAGKRLTGNVLLTENLAFVSSADETFAIHLGTRQAVWSTPIGGDLAWADEMLLISNPSGVWAFTVPVPEPAGLLLIAAAGLGLRWLRRRRAASPCGPVTP
jgi:hypothetical protein